MSTRDRLAVACMMAVLLASAALVPVFDGPGWVVRAAGVVLVVLGATAAARSLGLPRGLQSAVGVLALAGYVALVFAGSTLSYGVVPGLDTLRALAATVGDGLQDVEQLAPPVPTSPGLVLLAVLGLGAVAVVVDLLAVVLRRAALAGVPLLVLFAVPSAVLPGGTGVLPFVLGAAGWLGLLVADSSDTVSRWGTPLSSRKTAHAVADPSLGRTGRRIGVAALGVAVLVPALVPGLDARLLGGGDGDGFGGGSRSVTTYNPILRLAGQLSLPTPRELLRYRTDDPRPDYVRLTTLDVFDEDAGWSASELSGDPDEDRAQDPLPRPRGLTSAAEREVTATVESTGDLEGQWLPLPFPPRQVQIDGPWLFDEEAETVFSTRSSFGEVDEPYTVTARRVEPTVELLRRAQTVPTEIRDGYAVVPELSPYVRAEIEQVTAEQTTDYDRVAALQAYFRDAARFSYDDTASAPGLNAPDALENFLRGGVGFCEQYSSAMAAMVRGLGIPARVAVGFTPGTRDGEEYVVTTSEAHAWPEVWFGGAGWVRFEPTPRSDQTTTPGYSTAPAEVPVDGSAPSAAPSAAPSTAAPLPGQGPADRGADGFDSTTAGRDAGGSASAWLLVVPAALLLLAAPALLARLRSRRRWRRPDPQGVAVTAWAAVAEDAVDVGHRWRPADSPRAAAAHLLLVRPLPTAAGEALARVAAATERARYARAVDAGSATDQPPTGRLPTSLRRDVAIVRTGLLSTTAGRTRWLARLAPPSTLRWAAAGVGAALADVLDRADALVAAVGARARHPRARRAT